MLMQFSSNENFATHCLSFNTTTEIKGEIFLKLEGCFSKEVLLCVLQTHLPVLIRAFTWRWACLPQVSDSSLSVSLSFPLSQTVSLLLLYCYVYSER